jgi:hypothetical protein
MSATPARRDGNRWAYAALRPLMPRRAHRLADLKEHTGWTQRTTLTSGQPRATLSKPLQTGGRTVTARRSATVVTAAPVGPRGAPPGPGLPLEEDATAANPGSESSGISELMRAATAGWGTTLRYGLLMFLDKHPAWASGGLVGGGAAIGGVITRIKGWA